MADQSDVESALVAAASAALYPAGVPSPKSVSPVAGVTVRVSRGWPPPQQLDAVLHAGGAWVTVWPSTVRDTTRYARDPVTLAAQSAPLTLSLTTGNTGTQTVTLSGTVSGNGDQVIGVTVGIGVHRSAYAYRVNATDTLATAAAGLAAAVPAATSTGPAVQFTAATNLTVTTSSTADGGTLVPLYQQRQNFWIIVWAPSPAVRDATASALDVAMGQVRSLTFLDGSASGPLCRGPGRTIDHGELDGLFRRDLVYHVDYSTNLAGPAPAAAFFDERFTVAGVVTNTGTS